MKTKWLLLLLSVTSVILPMEESKYQAIQTGETHVEKALEEVGLPNEMWAKIIELAYSEPNNFLNLEILDEAKDIYEAIDIIEKYISKQLLTIKLVCKTFRALIPKFSKEELLQFKQEIRDLYIPYLNEKFLEPHAKFLEQREDKEGLYPKYDEWLDDDSKLNNEIAQFIAKPNTKIHVLLTIEGNLRIFKVLLFYGANPNLQDNEGETALIKLASGHFPTIRNNKDSIELLLRHGANPNLQDNEGQTALYILGRNHNSVNCNHTEMFSLLLEHGADLNLQIPSGWTILHLFAYKDYPEMISFLLQYGPNPNLQNSDGCTCLHFLAYYHRPINPNNTEIVSLLLKYGANPYIKNINEQTIFDVAKEKKFDEFPQLVKKHAQNTLTKICVLHILNNLALYEDKLHILPIELRDKINNLRSN